MHAAAADLQARLLRGRITQHACASVSVRFRFAVRIVELCVRYDYCLLHEIVVALRMCLLSAMSVLMLRLLVHKAVCM
jgi:hypothetical protein